MKDTIVRISEITINNFKNIAHSSISFDNQRKKYKASVLGLYGQNGSGKTALIDCISLLKLLLSGNKVPQKFADYIMVSCEYSSIKYSFNIECLNTQTSYFATYELKMKKELDTENLNFENFNHMNPKYKVIIYDEVLSCSYCDSNEKNNFKPIIDTSKKSDYAFEPRNRFEGLIGKEKNIISEVNAYKTIALHTSRSFIFSKELLTSIRNNESGELKYKTLLEALIYYGNFGLFVFNTSNTGLISMNALPLSFRINEEKLGAIGNLTIKLDGTTLIPQEGIEIVKKVIKNMNIVLKQIIPGLVIDVYETGKEVLPNNLVGSRIHLVSKKDGKEIPLKYESEGIKKIISILQLLIVLYNNSTITVAIDELDSGVFEYLLGEILKIISEKGKGQLIFTSHNLRPLETIDKGFIAFTTTNPNNRYIRFSNVKTNNNLRDFYYRDIILGEQNECVYEKTNNFEIALAFKEAGEYIGS